MRGVLFAGSLMIGFFGGVQLGRKFVEEPSGVQRYLGMQRIRAVQPNQGGLTLGYEACFLETSTFCYICPFALERL